MSEPQFDGPLGAYQWTSVPLYGGDVTAITFSPNFASDHTVFAGTRNQGVFRSRDGGQTWIPLRSGIPLDSLDQHLFVRDMDVSPAFANDRTVFAATNAGILRSVDAGENWQQIHDSSGASLVISPNFASDQTLFINGSRSTDGGATWSTFSYCCGDGLAVSPAFANDRIVLAGRDRSTDGGVTFVNVIAGFESGQDFAFSPNYAADGTVFAASGHGTIRRSQDRGVTWINVGSAGSNILDLAISPQFAADKTLWAATVGNGLRRSIDGGATWQILAGQLFNTTALYNAVAPAPDYTQSALLLAGSWMGLYRSNDTGDSWTTSQTGLLGMTVRRVAVATASGQTTILFVQSERYLFRSTDGGLSWKVLATSSGNAVSLAAVSPTYSVDHVVFGLGKVGVTTYLLRSQDGGDSWTSLPLVPCSNFALSPQYATDHTLWCVGPYSSSGPISQLYRSQDDGETWDGGVEVSRTHFPEDVALSPSFTQDRTALVVGYYGGYLNVGTNYGVFATEDGGDTWPFKGLPSTCNSQDDCWATGGHVAIFSPNYVQDGIAFVGMRQAGVGYTTSGVNTPAWVRSSFPVTDSVRTLAVSPAFGADGTVWAGTDGAGVYESSDRGQTWQTHNTNLLDLRIYDLAASPNYTETKTLYAGTGSGLWSYTLGVPGDWRRLYLPTLQR